VKFRRLINPFTEDLGVDLGTSNTLVYARGRGVVVNEPSVISFCRATGRVEAVGSAAKEMLGRTPKGVIAVEPLRGGVIAHLRATQTMFAHFIREALSAPLRSIVAVVRAALDRTPPELSADIVDRGIILTGGGALVRKLDVLLSAETGIAVSVAENPLLSVVYGAGMILGDARLLNRLT
jgi:actin-like ATPase involved in cell morphogenesis